MFSFLFCHIYNPTFDLYLFMCWLASTVLACRAWLPHCKAPAVYQNSLKVFQWMRLCVNFMRSTACLPYRLNRVLQLPLGHAPCPSPHLVLRNTQLQIVLNSRWLFSLLIIFQCNKRRKAVQPLRIVSFSFIPFLFRFISFRYFVWQLPIKCGHLIL